MCGGARQTASNCAGAGAPSIIEPCAEQDAAARTARERLHRARGRPGLEAAVRERGEFQETSNSTCFAGLRASDATARLAMADLGVGSAVDSGEAAPLGSGSPRACPTALVGEYGPTC